MAASVYGAPRNIKEIGEPGKGRTMGAHVLKKQQVAPRYLEYPTKFAQGTPLIHNAAKHEARDNRVEMRGGKGKMLHIHLAHVDSAVQGSCPACRDFYHVGALIDGGKRQRQRVEWEIGPSSDTNLENPSGGPR